MYALFCFGREAVQPNNNKLCCTRNKEATKPVAQTGCKKSKSILKKKFKNYLAKYNLNLNTTSSYDTTFRRHSTLVYFSWPLYHIAPFRSHILQDIRICSRYLQACIGRSTTLSRPYWDIAKTTTKNKKYTIKKHNTFFFFLVTKIRGLFDS
uniref:Uncharacterized protein n=1 Tax=Ixodes ricinus TaxID=34613 RepID=A0A6B0UVB3_IXORI